MLENGFFAVDSKDIDETLLDTDLIRERAQVCYDILGSAWMHCEEETFCTDH